MFKQSTISLERHRQKRLNLLIDTLGSGGDEHSGDENENNENNEGENGGPASPMHEHAAGYCLPLLRLDPTT